MTLAVLSAAWQTPLGADINAAVARLLAGEHAVTPNRRFAASAYACPLAATVPGTPPPSRDGRFLSPMGRWAVDVAARAFALSPARPEPERMGLYAAVGGLHLDWDDILPAFAQQRDDGVNLWNSGLRSLHPFVLLRYLSNNAHAIIAAKLGITGEGMTFAGANAGAQALAAADMALAQGAVDAVLIVAYDSLVHPEILVELAERGAATRATHAGTGGAGDALIAPYARGAAGFVPGEAAVAMVVDRPSDTRDQDKARAVLAHVRAAAQGDGQAGNPHADTVARVLRLVAAGDEGALDGAALADPAFDAAERAALAKVVGDAVHLCAIQAATGQLGAPASLVQAIALMAALRRGTLPPISGLSPLDLAGKQGQYRDPDEQKAPVHHAGAAHAGAAHPGPLSPVLVPTPAPSPSALAVCAGAPGSVGAIRVEVL